MKSKKLLLILVFVMLLLPSILFAATADYYFSNVSGIGYYDPGTNPDYSKMDVDDIIVYSKAAGLRSGDYKDNIICNGVKYVKSARELIKMAYHSDIDAQFKVLDNINRPDVVCDLNAKLAIEWVDKFWKYDTAEGRNKALSVIAERINDIRELKILLSDVHGKMWNDKIYNRIKTVESNKPSNSECLPTYYPAETAAPVAIELPQLDFKKMSAVEVAIYANYCYIKHYHHNREECYKICAREMLRASEHITSARDIFLLAFYSGVNLDAKCQETLLRRIANPEVIYDLPVKMITDRIQYAIGNKHEKTLLPVVISRIKSISELETIKKITKDITIILSVEERIKQLQISNEFSSKSNKKNDAINFNELEKKNLFFNSKANTNANEYSNMQISEMQNGSFSGNQRSAMLFGNQIEDAADSVSVPDTNNQNKVVASVAKPQVNFEPCATSAEEFDKTAKLYYVLINSTAIKNFTNVCESSGVTPVICPPSKHIEEMGKVGVIVEPKANEMLLETIRNFNGRPLKDVVLIVSVMNLDLKSKKIVEVHDQLRGDFNKCFEALNRMIKHPFGQRATMFRNIAKTFPGILEKLPVSEVEANGKVYKQFDSPVVNIQLAAPGMNGEGKHVVLFHDSFVYMFVKYLPKQIRK